eukprot:COSAG06_NODE_480_length_15163_cov_50.478757_14_plen_54_part_00
MEFTQEDLNELTRKDLEILAQDLKSNIVPRFTKIRKYEIVLWILTFQKYFTDE